MACRCFWSDPWQGMDFPSRLIDQNFGSLVPGRDVMRLPLTSLGTRHYSMIPQFGSQRRCHPQKLYGGISEVMNDEQEFRIDIGVQHFKPEEISVKTKDDRIIINARHEDRADEHGYIMREFTRQYILPKDVDPKTVKSSLSTDGHVLTLKAPKVISEDVKERTVPITIESEEA